MEREDDARSAADQLIAALVAERGAGDAVLALVEAANRMTVEVHRRARQEAQTQRGTSSWGAWAKLANAGRSAVLQLAACRDAARGVRDSA
jgi:hypothetical protein